MGESNKHNVEQKRTDKTVYKVWFYLYTVLNQSQLVYWVKSQSNGYLWGVITGWCMGGEFGSVGYVLSLDLDAGRMEISWIVHL